MLYLYPEILVVSVLLNNLMKRFSLRSVALLGTVHYPAGAPVRRASCPGETVTATGSPSLRVNLNIGESDWLAGLSLCLPGLKYLESFPVCEY